MWWEFHRIFVEPFYQSILDNVIDKLSLFHRIHNDRNCSSLKYYLRSLWQTSHLDPRGLAHEMQHYRPLSISVPIELIQITFSFTLFKTNSYIYHVEGQDFWKTKTLRWNILEPIYILQYCNIYLNVVHWPFSDGLATLLASAVSNQIVGNLWTYLIIGQWPYIDSHFWKCQVFANLLETELQKYFLIYDKFKHFYGD